MSTYGADGVSDALDFIWNRQRLDQSFDPDDRLILEQLVRL